MSEDTTPTPVTTPISTPPQPPAPDTTETDRSTANAERIIMTVVVVVFIAVVAVVLVIALMGVGRTDQSPNTTVLPQTDLEEFEPATNTPDVTIIDNPPLEFDGVRLIDPTDYSFYYKNVPPQPGVTWFLNPTPVDSVQIVQVKSQYREQRTPPKYLQIGTYYERPIYVATYEEGEMGSYQVTLPFLGQSSTSPLTLLTKHITYDFTDEFGTLELLPGVAIDTTTHFAALDIGAVLLPGGIMLEQKNFWFARGPIIDYFSNSQFNQNHSQAFAHQELVADTPYGPLFRGFTTDEDGTADIFYGLRTVGGFISYYDLALDYISDDRVLAITWHDGTKNTDPYRTDNMGGCGGGGPLVAVSPISETSLQVEGTTATGRTVYTLRDPNHPITQRIYKLTGGKVYTFNPETQETEATLISLQEFLAKRAIIIVKDDFGYQNVFVHTKYGPQAECAKPVVYLYPEATTTISVRLDALVTKSEPAYETGWTVVATPEGTLTVGGKAYTSLFWDGYGNGVYPELHEGFVVETNQALALMGDHLRYMGFNDTEVAEFSAFWAPHLPKEPYTQFSWIQTAGMQRLAALDITPRPRTLIRAFVDFKGLQKPVTIPPQTLKKQERVGYVVTEWGGLLRK